ncbi:hypothetical protein IWQ56_001231 [Coemansia nantahalensis]|uniref:Uncharacterized protein n=1 Tax=Coemansia nantahalensis TaxID=2789366 RepID=A0ACC1K544_9FUNG|nr:hypothetical protein IWQ56_001231 [Coemansia nantahalensis]KAJ2773605.1 hypothetical protein IWQ57_001220 [Coemansia nantahalensis]
MTAAWSSEWQPTEREQSAYAHLFSLVDTRGEGVVRGQAAVPFFQKSGLPDATLGEIWQLADSDSKGHLTAPEFGVAMKLISLAQAQRPVALGELGSEAGLPELKGIVHRADVGSPSTPSLAAMRGRSGSSTSSTGWARGLVGAAESLDNLPETVVPAREKQQYAQIFAGSGPVDGVLDGAAARALFTKTKLDNGQLNRIWALADPRAEGKLRLPGFIVAMYFIRRTMENRAFELPAVCPPSLWRSAGGELARSPLGSLSQTSLGGVLSPEVPAAQWDVTKDEWRRYEQFFDSLDSQRAGYLVGDVPVNFFLKSKLPEEELSRVWDLADTKHCGRLGKEEFAVAMHLINARLAGTPIPDRLPPTLVPPSMRRHLPASSSSNALSRVHSISPQLRPASAVGRVQQMGDIKRAASYSSSSLREPAAEPISRAMTELTPVPLSVASTADDSEIAALQGRIGQIEGQSQVLQGQRAATTGQLASATTRKQALEVRLAAVQSSHDAEQRINRELEARLADEEARVGALQEQVAEANKLLTAVSAQHGQLEQAVHRAQTQQLALGQRLHQAQEDERQLRAEIESLEAQKLQLEQRLAVVESQIRHQQQANTGLSQLAAGLKRDVDEAAQRVEAAEKESPSFDDIFGAADAQGPVSASAATEDAVSGSGVDGAAAASPGSELLPQDGAANTSAFDTFGAHSADPFEEFLQSATASPQPAATSAFGKTPKRHAAEEVDAKTKQFDALFESSGAPAATRSMSKPQSGAASWEAADPRSVTSTPAPGSSAGPRKGQQAAKSTPSSPPPLSGASKRPELLEASGKGFAADFGTAFGEVAGGSDRAISRDIEAFETKFPDIGALGITDGGLSGEAPAAISSGTEDLTFESVFGNDGAAAPKAAEADLPTDKGDAGVTSDAKPAVEPAAEPATEPAVEQAASMDSGDAQAPEQPRPVEAKRNGKGGDDDEAAAPPVVRRTNVSARPISRVLSIFRPSSSRGSGWLAAVGGGGGGGGDGSGGSAANGKRSSATKRSSAAKRQQARNREFEAQWAGGDWPEWVRRGEHYHERKMLTEMGYPKDRVVEALEVNDFNLTQATDYLLSS